MYLVWIVGGGERLNLYRCWKNTSVGTSVVVGTFDTGKWVCCGKKRRRNGRVCGRKKGKKKKIQGVEGRLGFFFQKMGGARCDQGGVEYKSPKNDWQQLVVARWAQKGHPIMVKSRAWKGLDMSRTKHRVNTQGDKRPRCCYRMGPIINYQLEERHTLLKLTTVCQVQLKVRKIMRAHFNGILILMDHNYVFFGA